MREEEKKRISPNSKLQQFFRKRWVFPAVYLVSAAVILTAVLWYQSVGNNVTEDLAKKGDTAGQKDNPAVEVGKAVENFAMPALDAEAVTVVKKFYEFDASAEDQEAALVSYNNTFRQNQGIDISKKDGKDFDVVASLSGTVVKAQKDPILGNVVEIEHEAGLVTVYQSLADVKVQAGDKVEQKQIIGKAGKNLYNEEDGIHVHFEVRVDGKAVNPGKLLDKPVSAAAENVKETEAAEQTEKSSEEAADENANEEQSSEEDAEQDENQPEAAKDPSNA
ncbi:peptidoglycan DD-metalloendopeptidase family protein [Bacillus lacus]|uniref:Peptidoglycan DD-metalloendopeptidase family protein n=1 Tax=Metabacillus lacus TaxID=1983721 RepID=A0A7X2J3P2_9BACI|nr:M23 family metallopeptidase [Metabacillus lacus]MRX74383.1 peptidoglycan DD-metalloendopeptidase family protein [Metabacillus lacus]